MTDTDIIVLCAKAMDYSVVPGDQRHKWGLRFATADGEPVTNWNPLERDDQAMLLVKKLHLHIDQRPGKQISVQTPHFEEIVVRTDGNLNRAICECAAHSMGAV